MKKVLFGFVILMTMTMAISESERLCIDQCNKDGDVCSASGTEGCVTKELKCIDACSKVPKPESAKKH